MTSWIADLIALGALTISILALRYSRTANGRSEEAATVPLLFIENYGGNFAVLNTGTQNIIQLAWDWDGKHHAQPLLRPGESVNVASTVEYLILNKLSGPLLVVTCEFPPSVKWRVSAIREGKADFGTARERLKS